MKQNEVLPFKVLDKMLPKENIILKDNMMKNYTDRGHYPEEITHVLMLSHIITSIHYTFLPQVHHFTPAKGQRPSFTLHIETKLPHSVLVQLNPRAFSINHLVKQQRQSQISTKLQ
jgi:hypothetical protein